MPSARKLQAHGKPGSCKTCGIALPEGVNGSFCDECARLQCTGDEELLPVEVSGPGDVQNAFRNPKVKTDGIFVATEIAPMIPASDEGFAAIWAEAFRRGNEATERRRHLLETIEVEARDVVSTTISSAPCPFAPGTRKYSEWKVALLQRQDAADILRDLAALRAFRKSGNTDEVIAHAISIGYKYLRLKMRVVSPHASAGRKLVVDGRKGNAVTHGTPVEKRARWKSYRDEFEALRSRNPHLSKEDCYRQLSRKFGVSPKTIKRHVADK